MSYTRSAWKREYTFGDSHLYSFIGEDDNLWIIGSSCTDGFEVVKKEDAFELIVSVLKCAGIKLSRGQLRKLAKELSVRLRKRPLSWKKMWNDMTRKSRHYKQ